MNKVDCVFHLKQSSDGYSQEQLKCRGRACKECGECRDWYHTGADRNGGFYQGYQKRKNAHCCGTRYVDHDGPAHLYDSLDDSAGVAGLCECSDNV